MQGINTAAGFPSLHPCWLTAPDERTPGFLSTFAAISLAIQTVLRERVPAAYFAGLENFHNVKTAYPMLVYQASKPFQGKMRPELTYDVLNPNTLAKFFRTAKPNLVEILQGVEARLRGAGLDQLATQYEPRRLAFVIQAVQRWNKSRKCLYILIRAEGVLVNTLVELGGLGSLGPKLQARRMASFEKKWRFQLRRLYPGTDFTWLATELLDSATQALLSAQGSRTELAESDVGLAGPEAGIE